MQLPKTLAAGQAVLAAGPSSRMGCVVRAQAPQQQPQCSPRPEEPSRRLALLGLAAGVAGGLVLPAAPAAAAKGSTAPKVGTLFPPAAQEGFVQYKPEGQKTPALRAGVIKPDPALYSFVLPNGWSEGMILNIASGNFCMPRCDEPWYEAVFQEETEGKVQLIVSPIYRLVSKSNATLKDVGTPEQLILKVGNFVTGTYLDEEDVLTAETKEFADGRTYYTYEVFSPLAKDSAHSVSAFTIKGDLAYLLVASASEKQWPKSQKILRTIVDSFQA